jgi:hypothetical protein
VKDGPFPTHYEPAETSARNTLYPMNAASPTTRFFESARNEIAHGPETEYRIVATTFRLTEHYLSGPMSRFNSWLNELQPEMFVELSPELAAEKSIEHGGWLTVRSASTPFVKKTAPSSQSATNRRARSSASPNGSIGASLTRSFISADETTSIAPSRSTSVHAAGRRQPNDSTKELATSRAASTGPSIARLSTCTRRAMSEGYARRGPPPSHPTPAAPTLRRRRLF